MIKKWAGIGGGIGIGIKAVKMGFEGIKNAMDSCASGQNFLAVENAKWEAAATAIYSRITGSSQTFNLSILESIKLAGKFQEKLNEFKDISFYNSLENTAAKLELLTLEQAKLKPGANVELIDLQIQGTKLGIAQNYREEGENAA
jgi:hypothetical protein